MRFFFCRSEDEEIFGFASVISGSVQELHSEEFIPQITS